MLIQNASILLRGKNVTVNVNGGDVALTNADTGEVLFTRSVNAPWFYDDAHRRLMEAVHSLEAAVEVALRDANAKCQT